MDQELHQELELVDVLTRKGRWLESQGAEFIEEMNQIKGRRIEVNLFT
jgi:hypothetical protein